MAQETKVLPAKPDDQCLVPGIQVVKGKNPCCSFIVMYVVTCAVTQANTKSR